MEKNFNREKIKRNNFNGEKKINSIRDINVEKRSYAKTPEESDFVYTKKSPFLRKILSLGGLLLLIGGILTFFFHSASFEIKNKVKSLNFKDEVLKANNIKPSADEIPFKLLKFDLTMEREVKSKMVETVNKKAVGKIKIINNTNKVQRLRKETRFEVDGKIFKTYKSAVIPAKSSVVKDAFADVAGKEYNLKKGLKMTIPGFKEVKDMDSYKKITGEIAEDFSGGFVGKRDIPDAEDLKTQKKLLEADIDNSALIEARKKLPEKYILNTDGIFQDIKYTTENKDGKLKLIAKDTVNIIIFNQNDFIAAVSGLDKKDIEKYAVKSTAYLKFKILNKDNLSVDNLSSFNFKLNGDLKYYKIFNKKDFLELVKGKSEDEYNKIIAVNYSKEDTKINKSVFPFWLSSIPDDELKISIDVVEEDE